MNLSNGSIQQIELWLESHVLLSCLVILFFSVSPRVFFALRVDLDTATTHYSDARTYLVPAHSILERGEFLDQAGLPYIHRTPGYPAFLSAIMFVFGQKLGTVLIVQSVFLASSVVALYLLARLILPQMLALITGLLASLSPWSIILSGIPMSDGLFLALLILIFYLMRLTVGSREIFSLACGGILIGLLTGIAVLVRPLWMLIPLITIASGYLYGRNRKRVWCLVVLVVTFASIPPLVWMQRNARESAYPGLSDVSGMAVWHYLAARVRSELTGEDKSVVSVAAGREIEILKLSVQDADKERWRRSMEVFREHPIITAYSFTRSAIEHSLNPSPDGLRVARLNFFGDYWILALLWGGLLFLSVVGFYSLYKYKGRSNSVQFPWLFAILIVCSVLTLCSGVSFHAGSRLRAPMEIIVPLLAGAGLQQIKRLLKFNRIILKSDALVE